jgi:ADP-ribose pyrophosphatase YjhB (NUDIX family)
MFYLAKPPIDAAVRELFEQTDLTLILDDLAILSGAVVRVPLSDGKHALVYVYSDYVLVPYVNANLRTPTKVQQVVIA